MGLVVKKKKVIVIGAGYAGMALANLLAKKGYKVDVYEKNETAGGRIQALQQDGFTFDIGPSWYLMPEIFEQYYDIFGLSAQKRLNLLRFTPGYKVFYENQPSLEIQGNVEEDKKTFEALEAGAGQQLEKYVEDSTNTYTMATKYFLYNTFRSLRDLVRWPILKSTARMLYLVSRPLDNYVSKHFRDMRLKQLLEYHMVFLGSSPFQAPAIYSLMSHLDFKSGVYYPKKGMLELARDMQAIGKSLGVSYHFNTSASRILTEGNVATAVEFTNGVVKTADIIVSNADLHHTETVLLEKDKQSFPEKYWAKRQPGPGALLMSLGIKGTLPELRHHNLYFVDKWRDNFSAIYETATIPKNASLYICNPTKTDPSLAPEGHENILVLMPIPANVTLGERQKEQLVERVVKIVSKVAGDPKLASRIVSRLVFGPSDFADKFNAWQYNAFGGESHLLSQSVIFRTPNKSRKLKNLYFVGAGTLPGIGLPMCLIGAQLTYKRIVNVKKSGPLTDDDF